MKDQSGKTPLEWILTISIVLFTVGVSIAMIFGGNEGNSSNTKNQNTNDTVQTVTNS